MSGCQNVLKMYECFEDDEFYYLVTPYMTGGDLFRYITKQPDQPLQERNVKRIIKQVLVGLKGLHSRNIIHRDIKIDNILMESLSEDAEVYIADVGSAAKLSSPEESCTF